MDYSYASIKAEILSGRELHFFYKKKQYSISYNHEGWYLTEFYNPHDQAFKSAEELLSAAKIDGKNLEEIWKDIEVDFLF